MYYNDESEVNNMTAKEYTVVSISLECGKLLTKIKEKEGTLKAFAVEKALIEKYPELAKEVGLLK